MGRAGVTDRQPETRRARSTTSCTCCAAEAAPGGRERVSCSSICHAVDVASDCAVASAQLTRLLTYYELEKVVYEVEYELNNRPDWLDIPLRGLLAVIGLESGT